MRFVDKLRSLSKYVPVAVWILVIATCVCIPLKIISYGYIPRDDANRHVAKVVSEKDWSEVMVLRDGVIHDHNPGWHAVLGWFHRQFGLQCDGLMVFSVASLMMLIMLCGLPWLRRPEAYPAALLIGSLTGLTALMRYSLGRPFIFSIVVLLTVLALWTRPSRTFPPGIRYAVTIVLLALATWVHGSWYLFLLPISAFVLAGQFRSAAALFACFVAAQPIGGALTGTPIAFLAGHINVLMGCFGNDTLQKWLVGEFQPSDGAAVFLLTVGAFLAWRRLRGASVTAVLRDPIFMMGVIGWILGLHVVRFWIDWGLPSLLLWMAFEIEHGLCARQAPDAPRRLVFAGFTCLALWLACTSDFGGRWTRSLHVDYLEQGNPDLAGWLPEEGGIIYSASMPVFYHTFFKNPHANWRYILGFEASFMPQDDLETFRDIQWNRSDPRTFQPWVDKMKPEDRLVHVAPKGGRLGIDELEWHYAATDLWIGRLPRPADDAQTTGAAKKDTPSSTPALSDG